ncbi:MAG: spore germination protein [Firmicutes bacterium]|nr:spore germination protein [Bacillota bacterium]
MAFNLIRALISRFMRRTRRGGFGASPDRSSPSSGRNRIDAELLTDDSLDVGARKAVTDKLALSTRLAENLRMLELAAGPSPDIMVRRIATDASLDAAVINLQGIVDQERIEGVVRAVSSAGVASAPELISELSAHLLRSSHVKAVSSFNELWDALSGGLAVVLADGHNQGLACSAQSLKTRPIEEPPTDTTLRGPRQGFIEDLTTNLAILRQWIRTPNLWIEETNLGHLTRTRLVIAYIKGLAGEELLAEVRQRVQRIETDSVLGTGPVEDFIQDTHLSFFPLILRTERPDRVVGNLLEGRVAIMVQNSPFALVAHMDYGMLFQSADDYYEPVPIVFVISVLRVIAFWTSILLPGAFVAVLTFHHELLPTSLLLRIVGDRAGVPFPVIAEVFLMELTFELLREAGLRLPRAVGSAVTIVGALVLGEAAINAGLVSPSVIIVVATTAIASFILPTFSFDISARLLRFAFIVAGGSIGLFGVQYGIIIVVLILAGRRSFGHPYLAPVAPFIGGGWKDYLFRTWHWAKTMRPKLTGGREPIRAPRGQMPRPGASPESEGRRQMRSEGPDDKTRGQ